MIPAEMPTKDAMIIASVASSIVAGSLILISSMTGFFFMFVPRLPWHTSETYFPNCT